MTLFEQFAMDTIGKVEIGEDGLYEKHTASLATITNDIILSDDEAIFEMPWEEQKKLIKEEFFGIYPYLK